VSAGAATPGGPAGRPPASLSLLCASLAAQVQVALGAVANPLTQKVERDLDAAKHGIDLLDVLEAKTRGNLDPEEQAFLSRVLFDLRMAYVEATRKPPARPGKPA
jgi:hypothetical protein